MMSFFDANNTSQASTPRTPSTNSKKSDYTTHKTYIANQIMDLNWIISKVKFETLTSCLHLSGEVVTYYRNNHDPIILDKEKLAPLFLEVNPGWSRLATDEELDIIMLNLLDTNNKDNCQRERSCSF